MSPYTLSFSRCHIKGIAGLQFSARSLPYASSVSLSKQLPLFYHQGTYQFHSDTSSHLFDSSVGWSLSATPDQQRVHSSFQALWEAQGYYLWLMWFLLLVLIAKLQKTPALLCMKSGRNLLSFYLPTATKTWLTRIQHTFVFHVIICLFGFFLVVSWEIKLKMPFISSLIAWKENQ